MSKTEALLLLDEHKNALLDPLEMLRWTWLRVIVASIDEDEWERYCLRAEETLAQ